MRIGELKCKTFKSLTRASLEVGRVWSLDPSSFSCKWAIIPRWIRRCCFTALSSWTDGLRRSGREEKRKEGFGFSSAPMFMFSSVHSATRLPIFQHRTELNSKILHLFFFFLHTVILVFYFLIKIFYFLFLKNSQF